MPIKSTASMLILIILLGTPAATALAETVTYTYDAMDRLTQVKYNDGTTVTYTYDKMGNRLTEQVVATAAPAPAEEAEAASGPPLPLRALPAPAAPE